MAWSIASSASRTTCIWLTDADCFALAWGNDHADWSLAALGLQMPPGVRGRDGAPTPASSSIFTVNHYRPMVQHPGTGDVTASWCVVAGSVDEAPSDNCEPDRPMFARSDGRFVSFHSRTDGRKRMIRLIAVAGFVLAVATSAQAMTAAPIHQQDGMVSQIALGCGPGRTRVRGVCVARTTIRHARRARRRCALWRGGVCRRWF
jgi:hypothetical protein